MYSDALLPWDTRAADADRINIHFIVFRDLLGSLCCIRKVSSGGIVTTVAGNGIQPGQSEPQIGTLVQWGESDFGILL